MAAASAKKIRPKYLSLPALLFEIRLPVPGWVSILHRISGALLFYAQPTRYLPKALFWVKMVLMVFAGINALYGPLHCGANEAVVGSNGRLVIKSARKVASAAATIMLIAIHGSKARGA